MKNKNKDNKTVPKGYRLKHTTHKRIKKLQKLLKLNQDSVISNALKLLDGKIKIQKQ